MSKVKDSAAPVRVRFAPSPTGDFHVGGARTALYNWLFARHHGGQFILRIEDTDRKRFDADSLQKLLEGLQYLELDWDEGPDKGGPHEPYTQSERLDIYADHVQRLIDSGHAYRCFCSPERLQKVVEEQKTQKSSFIGYDRHCRSLTPEASQQRVENGEKHTVRFKMPLEGESTVQDQIRGEISFRNDQLQDAVLMKSEGTPTYHLANVVDDHLMQITHILRGDEWVNSWPLHIHLYHAFGWDPPVMAHLPIILNPAGKGKMSKREQRAPDGHLLPVFVRQFQSAGYLSEALVNYMALVGWSFDDQTEIMTREALIERFSLDRVHTSPAAWDYEKLDHINSHYLRQMTVDDLADRLTPFLEKEGITAGKDRIRRIVPLIQERIVRLDEVVEKTDFFFMDELPEYDPQIMIHKKGDRDSTLKALEKALTLFTDDQLEFTHDGLSERLREAAKELGLKAGVMFQPIRVAVCGKLIAPPLFETLEVLGRETVMKRVRNAIAILSQ